MRTKSKSLTTRLYAFVINEYLSQPAKLGKFYLLMAALLLPSEGASFFHCWMRKVGMFWDGHDCLLPCSLMDDRAEQRVDDTILLML